MKLSLSILLNRHSLKNKKRMTKKKRKIIVSLPQEVVSPPTDILSLPGDILLEIVGRVASSSFLDLLNLKQRYV